MPNVRVVTDADLPQLFQAADTASLAAQKQYVKGTQRRLIFLVVSAALGITSWRVGKADVDILAIGSLVLFVLAVVVEAFLWKNRPDKTWYDARAVAESAKTLAWRFAVRGQPFSDPNASEADTTRLLLSRLDQIRAQYSGLDLAVANTSSLSPWMTQQRSKSQTSRRQTYLQQRVKKQQDWYASKAEYNKKRSRQWRYVLVGAEVTGIGASFVSIFWKVPSLGGALAALVVAVVAWLGTKQHDFNARAYSAAVADLAQAQDKLRLATDEAEWAQEVENTEEAISREHTLWLASRNET